MTTYSHTERLISLIYSFNIAQALILPYNILSHGRIETINTHERSTRRKIAQYANKLTLHSYSIILTIKICPLSSISAIFVSPRSSSNDRSRALRTPQANVAFPNANIENVTERTR